MAPRKPKPPRRVLRERRRGTNPPEDDLDKAQASPTSQHPTNPRTPAADTSPRNRRLRQLVYVINDAEDTPEPSRTVTPTAAANNTMAGAAKRRASNPPLMHSQKQRRLQPTASRSNEEGCPVTTPHRQSATHGRIQTSRQEREEPNEPRGIEFPELTGLLPGDMDAITAVVNGSESRLMNHIIRISQKQIVDFKEHDSLMKDIIMIVRDLDTKISNLNTLTLRNSASIARGRTAVRGAQSKGSKTAFEKEVEGKRPAITVETEAVFHPGIFCTATGQSVSSYMDFFHRAQDDHRMTARTLSVLLYGLQETMLQRELKQGVGKQYANLRYKIALCGTRLALKVTDEDFSEHEKQVIADLVRDGKITPGQIKASLTKPSWLTPRTLTRQYMEHARKFHDCVKSEHLPLPKPESAGLSIYICRHVINTVISMLRSSRERSKVKLFDAGLFLLSDWTKRRTFKSGRHTQPVLQFVNPTCPPILPQSLPDCCMVNEEQYDIKNNRILKELISSREEMIVEATYMVEVIIKKKRRNKDEEDITEWREMRTHVNILRMALSFMEGFMKTSEEIVLSSHPSILRNIYRLAILFREFFIDEVEESCRPIRASASRHDGSEDNYREPSTRSNSNAGHIQQENDSQNQSRARNGDRNRTRERSASSREESRSALPRVQLHHLLTGTYNSETIMTKRFRISLELYEKLNITDCNEAGNEEEENRNEHRRLSENGDGCDLDDLDYDEEDMNGMLDMEDDQGGFTD